MASRLNFSKPVPKRRDAATHKGSLTGIPCSQCLAGNRLGVDFSFYFG